MKRIHHVKLCFDIRIDGCYDLFAMHLCLCNEANHWDCLQLWWIFMENLQRQLDVNNKHEEFMPRKPFPHYWHFIGGGDQRYPMDFPRKGQWCGALRFSILLAGRNCWKWLPANSKAMVLMWRHWADACINDLVQDCSCRLLTHWSYCSPALSHRYILIIAILSGNGTHMERQQTQLSQTNNARWCLIITGSITVFESLPMHDNKHTESKSLSHWKAPYV